MKVVVQSAMDLCTLRPTELHSARPGAPPFSLLGAAVRQVIRRDDGDPAGLDEPLHHLGSGDRIGGLVEGGSLVRGQGEEIRFNVTDGGAAVPVTYKGVLPDLFEENQGMVGMGTYDGKVFRATEILAKHDEDYMPKEVVDALKEQGVYQEPEAQYNGHNSGS